MLFMTVPEMTLPWGRLSGMHARAAQSFLWPFFAKMASVDLAVLNDHELDLNTTMMYRHEDYVDAISFVHKGLVQLKPLMSRHFPFRAFHDAYVYIDENREKTMKVLIDVDDLREDNLSPASGRI